MTRALFLAWSPAIRRVFFPTACGYWEQHGAVTRESQGKGQAAGPLGQEDSSLDLSNVGPA